MKDKAQGSFFGGHECHRVSDKIDLQVALENCKGDKRFVLRQRNTTDGEEQGGVTVNYGEQD
ncbi:hypothetical protein EYF80_016837 [Liparis tanakae]|uniref:Uncharacterized protein n=1 Tax=Liparis tanakae TaxID=230148 RepID=A0A4Z2I4M1_9TELE|nr:hypothetical protein EYF80_016837 [Liparis tanakae]